ncbi:deoxyribodipyrimidine photo-lyase [Haloechinothrix salitolerans]
MRGDPVDVVPALARACGAASVHISADTAPYGRERDAAVAKALGGDLVATGSPYAVTPGRVRKQDGTPYRVFTPFSRAWLQHGWRGPAATDVAITRWVDPANLDVERAAIPADPDLGGVELPDAGEEAALAAWRRFRADGLADYDERRDRPDVDGTSMLSPYLRWGCVHPRTLLADLGSDPGATSFRNELAWREFHADVLWHRPDTARRNYDERFDALWWQPGPDAESLFDTWREGRTGYPIVDAGMRQLLHHGWMHNRVRMVVASFLVKDLHVPWQWGARHFMRHLVDGDLASNQLNWQWVAGSGTDAAPYFRIFNPTTQGQKFDPVGDYVRAHVPELRGIAGKAVHEPWRLSEAERGDYPLPIVDHAVERQEALRRYGEHVTRR